LRNEINIDEYDEKHGEKCDDKDDNYEVYGVVPFVNTVLEAMDIVLVEASKAHAGWRSC
jgi:hypothetical protein